MTKDGNDQHKPQHAGDEKASELIRERIARLHEKHNTPKKAHEHHPASRPDPAKDRQAYEAWYYSLSPQEQEREWQRYYAHPHVKAQPHQALSEEAALKFETQEGTRVGGPGPEKRQTVGALKEQVAKRVGDKSKVLKHPHLKPFITAVIVGMVFLFINFNELLLGQIKLYISPASGSVSQGIVDPNAVVAVGAEPKIIIPKINVDVPVVYTETSYDEHKIQQALEQGVVHYGTTPVPGQAGNVVIVGHSSNNFLNAGKYKFAFVLLDRLEAGDTFSLHFEGKRYVYKVYEKKVVAPNDFSVIQPTDKPIVTLITCTPPGTAWRRLVVHAEQIIPDPSTASAVAAEVPDEVDSPIPGNTPSLFDRFRDFIF